MFSSENVPHIGDEVDLLVYRDYIYIYIAILWGGDFSGGGNMNSWKQPLIKKYKVDITAAENYCLSRK
jgi:hypothetical protein